MQMATDFDPYRILGIDKRAFSDDIYNAYQRAIAEHPNDAQAQREIEAAYAVLGNIEQRREYDARVAAREALGTPVPSQDSIAATRAMGVGPGAVANVPWTLMDMGRALILPLLLIALNVGAAIFSNIDTNDLTETDYIVNFGFGFILEGALLALAWHFGIRKYKLSWRAFGFFWPKNLVWWFPIAIIAAAMGTIMVYVLALSAVGADPQGNVPDKVYDYVIPIIMLGVLSVLMAPFVEEIFFRAFLYQGFAKKWGMYAGIGLSGFVFGLAHVADADTLLIAPAIGVIGCIFAWSYAKTGSIYPSLIAHVIFNLISFAAGFWQ